MKRTTSGQFIATSFSISVLGLAMFGTGMAGAESTAISFNRDIRPILSDRCYLCHGPDEAARQADLRLDDYENATDWAIVPGDPDASEVLARVTSSDPETQMPPPDSHKPQFSAEEVAKLRAWIAEGAVYENHWAFVAPDRPSLPDVSRAAWRANPVDRFVLSRLNQEGLEPSPGADRRTLLRRAALDLTGLPPTLAHMNLFLADSSPDAWSQALDRLFASPTYGEHQARFWLDAARYADSNGYQYDFQRDQWAWRDWVIHAFNGNLPFDQFTIEQLAGDLLPGATDQQRLATGFNRNHPITVEGGIIDEEYRTEYVIDRIVTTGATWMGMTIGCARCHDHKYDPISQADFYQLFGFFNQVPEKGMKGFAPQAKIASPMQLPELQRAEQRLAAAQSRFLDAFEAWSPDEATHRTGLEQQTEEKANNASQALEVLRKPIDRRTAAEQLRMQEFVARQWGGPDVHRPLEEFVSARERHAELLANVPATMIMQEKAGMRKTYILERGEYDKLGREVQPNTPASLPAMPPDFPCNRLGLAPATMPNHPLTARVTVNRFWQQLFGVGLVDTPEDFGMQGSAPSHPQLLDWLAVDFVESEWDVKALLKTIMLSQTYRQSSTVSPDAYASDPTNRWLARGPRHRLDAETIRDSALAVSGLLNYQIGGPSVFPYHPKGLWIEVNNRPGFSSKYKQDTGEKLYRRSLYTFWKRTVPPPTMAVFDAPAREFCQVRRSRTNTPLQAFALLHDPQFIEAARALAERMLREGGTSIEQQIRYGFQQCLGRPPTRAEQEILFESHHERLDQYQQTPSDADRLLAIGDSPRDERLSAAEHAAMTSVARLLLNLSEFITKG